MQATLSHYRVLEQIGQGGMGVVYRAHDEGALDRDVALKVLPSDALADEAARKRFRKEATALSRLNHPNIATVFEFGSENGADFLVEELIPGLSLNEMVVSGPLSEREVINLGSQLCAGLAAAHEQGIVHRDLKPANIRVTPDARLKILDFGLARVLHTGAAGDTDATASLTETQAVSGTFPYMAPEQLLNEKLDARADIWAAGCVLYEMATGQRPFLGYGPALIDAILHRTPTTPSKLNHKISPGLEAIILKCLEKDPALRYGSAREVVVDLHRLGAGTVTAALTARRRSRWIKFAGIIGLLLIMTSAALWYWRYRRERAVARGPKVIAVLYFKNVSQDASLDWLNGGLTEMLTTNLGQIQGLEVLSSDRIASIRKRLKLKPDQELTADTAPEVAREAGADAFVTGAVMRLGPSRLRADVRLQDASTGRLLFSDKVESGDINGIFAMVDTITVRLSERVLPGDRSTLATAPAIEEVTTSNVEALRHFQAGVDYHRRLLLPQAIREYEQAVRLDAQFAQPYLRLYYCYGSLGDHDKAGEILSKLEPLRVRLPRAEQLEYQAIRAGDYSGAVQAREALLRERPRDAGNRYRLAFTLQFSNEPQRAVAILREGLTLDPRDHFLWNGLIYREAYAGNEAAALQAWDRYRALLGDSEPDVWDTRGDVLYVFEHYSEAEAAYRKSEEVSSGLSIKVPILHSQQGKNRLALDELSRIPIQELVDRADVAMVEAQLPQSAGEPEAALPLYRSAISRFMSEKQPALVGRLLVVFASFAIAVGKEQAALDFAQQHKMKASGSELAVSLLQAALGDESAAEEALARYSTADQEFSGNVDRKRALNQTMLALKQGNKDTLARVFPQLGDAPVGTHPVPFAFVELVRARAAFTLNDYSGAERGLLLAMRNVRADIMNSNTIRQRMPVIEHLCHFYLGKVYEASGRRDAAVREYRSFLAHYTHSRSRMPEIAQARAALKRLGEGNR